MTDLRYPHCYQGMWVNISIRNRIEVTIKYERMTNVVGHPEEIVLLVSNGVPESVEPFSMIRWDSIDMIRLAEIQDKKE